MYLTKANSNSTLKNMSLFGGTNDDYDLSDLEKSKKGKWENEIKRESRAILMMKMLGGLLDSRGMYKTRKLKHLHE